MKKLIALFLSIVVTSVSAQQSILVYNMSADKITHQQNIHQKRPIASITKLMTAMVTLDYNKDLTRRLMLSKRVGSNLPRQTYTRYELLSAMLVRSDNAAAETLAEDYPGGRKAFIQAMNQMAVGYGMTDTNFDDPTGISALNTSTAVDVAMMIEAASGYWLIREASTKKQVEIETQTKRKINTVRLHNTNSPVLFEFDSIAVSKTGFTSRAGWCLAMAVDKNKQQYAVVILGSSNKQERVKTAERLMYNHMHEFPIEEDYWKLSFRNNKFIPSSPSW